MSLEQQCYRFAPLVMTLPEEHDFPRLLVLLSMHNVTDDGALLLRQIRQIRRARNGSRRWQHRARRWPSRRRSATAAAAARDVESRTVGGGGGNRCRGGGRRHPHRRRRCRRSSGGCGSCRRRHGVQLCHALYLPWRHGSQRG